MRHRAVLSTKSHTLKHKVTHKYPLLCRNIERSHQNTRLIGATCTSLKASQKTRTLPECTLENSIISLHRMYLYSCKQHESKTKTQIMMRTPLSRLLLMPWVSSAFFLSPTLVHPLPSHQNQDRCGSHYLAELRAQSCEQQSMQEPGCSGGGRVQLKVDHCLPPVVPSPLR